MQVSTLWWGKGYLIVTMVEGNAAQVELWHSAAWKEKLWMSCMSESADSKEWGRLASSRAAAMALGAVPWLKGSLQGWERQFLSKTSSSQTWLPVNWFRSSLHKCRKRLIKSAKSNTKWSRSCQEVGPCLRLTQQNVEHNGTEGLPLPLLTCGADGCHPQPCFQGLEDFYSNDFTFLFVNKIHTFLITFQWRCGFHIANTNPLTVVSE